MFAGFGGFPFSSHFDDFPNFSEFHTFPQRRPRRSSTFKYYDTLGVAKDATPVQIRKAFQQLAMRMHPDKGGDPEKFKEISEAYEVLRDENKRRHYDQVGDEGLREGETTRGGSGTVDDLFDELMGMCRNRRSRSPFSSSHGPEKSPNVTRTLSVSLEDIYNGTTKHLAFTRQRSCVGCKGTGCKGAVRLACDECHGHGVKVVVMRYGPAVVQEVQTKCDSCDGSGLDCNPLHYCEVCCGAGELRENKTLDVYIEQGMPEKHPVAFPGEASCSNPLMQPGDVIVKICAMEHSRFTRKNADLLHQRVVSLCDSICGVEFSLKHLDGRRLHIKTEPGEIIKPGHVKCVDGEGMPVHGQPSLRGNLYISFDVTYPDRLNPEHQLAIRSILQRGGSQASRVGNTDEAVAMRNVQDLEGELKARDRFGRQHGTAYDSDDSADMPRGRRRVQCSQQ